MSEKRNPKELNENELKSVTGGDAYPTITPPSTTPPSTTPPPAQPLIADGITRIWAKCNNCGCEFIWREISLGVVTFEHEKCTKCGSYDFAEIRRNVR